MPFYILLPWLTLSGLSWTSMTSRMCQTVFPSLQTSNLAENMLWKMSTRSVAFPVSHSKRTTCDCLLIGNFLGAKEIMAYLLKNKLINGDNMTVTGRTLGENLERWTHKYGELDSQQDLFRPLDNPIKSSGHIRLIYFYLGSNVQMFNCLILEY